MAQKNQKQQKKKVSQQSLIRWNRLRKSKKHTKNATLLY